jgi:hypothetical protein
MLLVKGFGKFFIKKRNIVRCSVEKTVANKKDAGRQRLFSN